jgi:hypothetical protein
MLIRRMPELVERIMAKLPHEVAFYGLLPEEELTGDIAAITRENLHMFGRMLREGAPPSRADLNFVALSAAHRADELVPLGDVLHAYYVGAFEAWRLIAAEAGPDDLPDLRRLTEVLFDYLGAVSSTVSSAYLEEREALSSARQVARHGLATALLAGEPAADAATRAGLRLPPGYLVLALALAAHPDEAAGRPGAAVATRRKLRRIGAVLDRFAGDTVLSVLDGSGGAVLLPSAAHVADRWSELVGLIADVTEAAGAEVTAAVGHCAPDEVARTAEQTREVLRIARAAGRGPGLHRLEDVLLEYPLAAATDANRRLAALLDPLRDNEELLTTLRVHLANELNRRRTAAELHLHPNTVDYRLRRITQLTDLDVTVPSQQRLLVAALTARSLAAPPA